MDTTITKLKNSIDELHQQEKKNKEETMKEVTQLKVCLKYVSENCNKKIEGQTKIMQERTTFLSARQDRQNQRVQKIQSCLSESAARESANLKIIDGIKKQLVEHKKDREYFKTTKDQMLQSNAKQFQLLMDTIRQFQRQTTTSITSMSKDIVSIKKQLTSINIQVGQLRNQVKQNTSEIAKVNKRLDNLEEKIDQLNYIIKDDSSMKKRIIQSLDSQEQHKRITEQLVKEVSSLNGYIRQAELHSRVDFIEQVLLTQEKFIAKQLGVDLMPSDYIPPDIRERSLEKVVQSKLQIQRKMTKIIIEETFSNKYESKMEGISQRIIKIEKIIDIGKNQKNL